MIKKFFREHKLKSSDFTAFCKYFVVQFIIFAVIVFFVVAWIVYKLGTDTAAESEIRTMSFENMSNAYFEQVERIASSLSFADDVGGYLYGINSTEEKRIQKMLINYKLSVKYIDSIYLYSANKKLLCTTDTVCRNKTELERFRDYEFLKWLDDNEWGDTYVLPRKIGDRYPKCISVIKKSGIDGAYVVINIGYDLLIDNINRIYSNPMRISALNSDKEIVLSDFANEENNRNVFKDIENKYWNKKEGVIYSVVSIGHYKQYFGLEDDVSTYSKEKWNVILLSGVALLLFLLISVIIAGVLSMPLINVRRRLHSVLDEKDINVSAIRDEEEREIFYKIITLIDENKEFRAELDERLAEYKKAQIMSLQKQINPHFLNNILSTISYNIAINGGENSLAVKMIVKLTRILKYGFNIDNSMVTIKCELEFISEYVKLLKIGYGDFEYTVDIEEGLEDFKVLRMSIQPIVENAVSHGIYELRENGRIKIKVYSTENSVIISVWNNGEGIDQGKLRKINNYIRTGESAKSNGLYNTYKRFRLLFGDECKMWMESDGESWCCAYIEIHKS